MQVKLSLAAAVIAAFPLSVSSSGASAAPANGLAVSHISQQVTPVINIATKRKKKAQAQTQASPATCPADQVRSNRTGACIHSKSQN